LIEEVMVCCVQFEGLFWVVFFVWGLQGLQAASVKVWERHSLSVKVGVVKGVEVVLRSKEDCKQMKSSISFL
jgi:hypothetical protein